MAPGLGDLTRRIDRLLAGAGLPALDRSAWVEVDTDALIANASALCTYAGGAALGAVVKADGYGHGLEMAARSAIVGGASWLCVANAGEAARLRNDGYEGRIFVLYPVPTSALDTMSQMGVDITVGSSSDVERIDQHLDTHTPALRVHVEVDTGMTRGGLDPVAAVGIAIGIAAGERVTLAGVWTHLAAPEDDGVTRGQLARLDNVLANLRAAGTDPGVVHASASGGLLSQPTSRHDLVRPGLAFYGVHPGAGDPLPVGVRPALAVKAHAVRIARVQAGTSVGYAGTWTTSAPSTIATLPIGYADGWSRSSARGSWVLVAGRKAPLVGRVSSDAITVDVTGIEGVAADSEFVLLGTVGDREISADDIAAVRQTISWEVLQQLGSRLSRIYYSGGVPVAQRPESMIGVTRSPGRDLLGY